jgi:hypothetical protein
MRTVQQAILAVVLVLVVATLAVAGERDRRGRRNFDRKDEHKVQKHNLVRHDNAHRIYTGKRETLTQAYRGNDYHVKYAKKYDFGYVYQGQQHNHWDHRYYSEANQQYFYWCPCSKSYYWYCPEHQCYYPYGYTPAGYPKTFTW